MKLTFEQYKDKVKACWLGKNIGGTLGAPFECVRGVYDIDYYTHDITKGVLPNDDLDLQLVWLNAAEKYGKNVDAKILGEYWISYINADWSEYGAGKNNLKYGLCPPISGAYKNHNKDSCGAFIRSEIWACLAPGHPEIAAKYAYEDAICDHADEGVYGEVFCAALESAAFVESDREKLVEIALAFIPKDCAIARVVELARNCYEDKMTWKEARKKVLQQFPGSFGMYRGYINQEPEDDVPTGELGYDVPSNIGLMMIGYYFGEGDFSKSICIAAGCAEDADCTAGTVASVLGIIGGTACIEEKWLVPIGDEIKVISADLTNGQMRPPQKVSDLTTRVINLMPTFMHGHISLDDNGTLCFNDIDTLLTNVKKTGIFTRSNFADEISAGAFLVKKSNCLFDVQVNCGEGISIKENISKHFDVTVFNNLREQQWIECTLHLPEEWGAAPSRQICVNLNQFHGGSAVTKFEFTLTPQALTKGRYDVLLEIKSNGRLNKMFVELPLIVE